MEEQLKPLSVKLTVRVNISKYKAALARNYNVKPEEVEVIIEEDDTPSYTYQGVQPQIETVAITEPKDRKENATGPVVGNSTKGNKPYTWLHYYLLNRGLTKAEAAKICGVVRTTLQRACRGQCLRKDNYESIARGLNLTHEEKMNFKRSLTKAQRNLRGKELMAAEPTKAETSEPPIRWLSQFLKANKLEREEAMVLCDVSRSTIGRACAGYRLENPTFDKIVEGLGLTAEQATEFRNSLTRKQGGYTR